MNLTNPLALVCQIYQIEAPPMFRLAFEYHELRFTYSQIADIFMMCCEGEDLVFVPQCVQSFCLDVLNGVAELPLLESEGEDEEQAPPSA